MAAELSTGLILMAETLETGKNCSMLVTDMKATFIKKAGDTVYFTCSPNEIINDAINLSLSTNEPVKFVLMSEGKLKDGTVVANFDFEWSLKFRSWLFSSALHHNEHGVNEYFKINCKAHIFYVKNIIP